MALLTHDREHPAPEPAGPIGTPSATRVRQTGWRDPRLWIGVAIVAASVVLGARVMAGADDTVTVWSAGADLPAGTTLDASDLVATQVHFADEADLGAYLTAADAVPEGAVLLREVDAGELLPRSALGEGLPDDVVDLAVPVPVEQVPGSVAVGSVVDVQLLPGPGGLPVGAARAGWEAGQPVLAQALVVEVGDAASATSGTVRRLVLEVDADEAEQWYRVRSAFPDPVVSVAVHP
ncbi:hypothetical protein [Nocardioides sp. GY 10127]|uniref:hypothetical protein n=1 Tax=Nocardioides sp. GY 10127 TaxID=2569762 RepID=UPI0010A7FD54|nr:hypothetical protein [Nocardioides sp. GY 10127]TIC81649.1 hypothetical protein E8D37_10630 [Nocardioides sp. GY 10127]